MPLKKEENLLKNKYAFCNALWNNLEEIVNQNNSICCLKTRLCNQCEEVCSSNFKIFMNWLDKEYESEADANEIFNKIIKNVENE